MNADMKYYGHMDYKVLLGNLQISDMDEMWSSK